MPDDQTSRPLRCLALALGLSLVAAGPAASQTTEEDWDLTREGRTTMAMIAFNEGVGVAVRCRHMGLDLVLVGLPPATEGSHRRSLEIGLGSAAPFETYWMVGEPPTAATALVPGYLSRTLREGGMFRVIVPAEGDRRRAEYRLPLPRSESAVNHVLTACRQPLQDDRDEAARAAFAAGDMDIDWRRRPAPLYPDRAATAGIKDGMAHLSCLPRADGRLEECRIESEYPATAGFGAAAVHSMRDARVSGEIVDPGRPIFFTIRFRLG